MAHPISVGSAVSRGWETFAKRPLFFVGVLLLVFVIGAALQIPSVVIDVLTPDNVKKIDAASLPLFLIGGWFTLVFSLIGWSVQHSRPA